MVSLLNKLFLRFFLILFISITPSSQLAPYGTTAKHRSPHQTLPLAGKSKKTAIRAVAKQTHPAPINKTPFSQRAKNIDQQLLRTPRYFTAVKQLAGTPVQIRFFHLIYPDIQPNSVVGFHHDYKLKLHKQGLYQMKITKKLPAGAYTAKISTKNKYAVSKSFFPPQWDDRKLVHKIIQAVNNPIKQPVWSATNNSWNVTGMTKEGLKIKIAFTNTGVITTAFPA